MTVATANPSKRKRMNLTGRDMVRLQTAWETSTKRPTSLAYDLNANHVEFRISVINSSIAIVQMAELLDTRWFIHWFNWWILFSIFWIVFLNFQSLKFKPLPKLLAWYKMNSRIVWNASSAQKGTNWVTHTLRYAHKGIQFIFRVRHYPMSPSSANPKQSHVCAVQCTSLDYLKLFHGPFYLNLILRLYTARNRWLSIKRYAIIWHEISLTCLVINVISFFHFCFRT